ncbi:unnamed protein product [Prorocentrum cordatum]|uniref:Pentatricopeptide repeat-containing protein n=1 Tax=Prorocentrum cordatum TaxID=2364126 RepID=A0ABN9WQ31_9DINO|nr:unnamed protein product [Polarella glacialis]
MRELRLEPDVVSHSVGISACAKGGQWQPALALLSEMWEVKLEPNLISYSAGISACEKCDQWLRALALLSAMRGAKLEPDVIHPRWDQRVREGRALETGFGAAQRDLGFEGEARRGAGPRRLHRRDQRVREG